MRVLVTVTILLASAVVHAQPSTPPSKTLERAVKLYDKQDYLSAAIELKKVLDGESGDDAENKQRAEFFAGKTLFHLDLHAAALAFFDRIVQAGAVHIYRDASLAWLLAIDEKIDAPVVRQVIYELRDAAEARKMLGDPESVAMLDYLVGRHAAERGAADADARLAKVFSSSTLSARARLESAKLAFRRREIDAAIRHVVTAAQADAAVSRAAAGELASWTHVLGVPQRAAEPLGAIDNGVAKLQRSRLVVEKSMPTLAGVAASTFDAVVRVAACGKPPTSDAIPVLQAVIADGKKHAALVLRVEDHAEVFDAMKAIRKASPMIDVAASDPVTAELVAWSVELAREIELLSTLDRAWQTTQIAADILQELTVQQSLARATAGERFRFRIEALGKDLARLEQVLDGAGAMKLAMGPDATAGLVVATDLCTAPLVTFIADVDGATALAPPIAGDPPPSVHKPRGCGGCGAGGDAGFVIVLAVLLIARAGRSGSLSIRDIPRA